MITLLDVIACIKISEIKCAPKLAEKGFAIVVGETAFLSPAMCVLLAGVCSDEEKNHLFKNIPCNVLGLYKKKSLTSITGATNGKKKEVDRGKTV